jgi:hypothetical protein
LKDFDELLIWYIYVLSDLLIVCILHF